MSACPQFEGEKRLIRLFDSSLSKMTTGMKTVTLATAAAAKL